jgi:hypothetical protein
VVVLSYTFVSAATGSAAPGGPGSDDVVTGTAAPVAAAAPQNPEPVSRKGQGPRPKPTISANEGKFAAAAPATFSDGVSLTVDSVARGVEQGQGPGVFHGLPHVAVTLTLTNNSTKAIDLTQVVVTTTYGTPPVAAPPVYGDAAADFTGTVQPGGKATATYMFSIPAGQGRSAVMSVDFDDTHVAARFTGLDQ